MWYPQSRLFLSSDQRQIFLKTLAAVFIFCKILTVSNIDSNHYIEHHNVSTKIIYEPATSNHRNNVNLCLFFKYQII